MGRTGGAFDRFALAVLAVTTIMRVAAAIAIAPEVVADAQGYEAAAGRLAATGSYAYPLPNERYWSSSDGSLVVTESGRDALLSAPPNAYTMPGYPALRALAALVAGDGEAARTLTRVVQALLSVLTLAFVYLLARRFGPRAGRIALVLGAVYPSFTLANSYLLSEVLFTAAFLGHVVLVLRWTDDRSWTSAALAGATLALAVWVRPALALWPLLAAVVLVVSDRRSRARRIGQTVALGLVALVLVAPWWVRNWDLYGRFVPFGTGSGVVAVEATRMDVAVPEPYPWQRAARVQSEGEARIEALVADVYAAAVQEAENDLVQMDYYASAVPRLRSAVFAEAPGAALLARARSTAGAVLMPYAVSPWALGGVPFGVAWLAHVAVLGLAGAGVALRGRATDVLVLATVPAYTLAVHAVILPLNRYLFPAMPVVVVLAAIGLDALATRRLRGRDT